MYLDVLPSKRPGLRSRPPRAHDSDPVMISTVLLSSIQPYPTSGMAFLTKTGFCTMDNFMSGSLYVNLPEFAIISELGPLLLSLS